MKRKTYIYSLLRILLPLGYAAVLAAGIAGRDFITMMVLLAAALIGGAFFCGWLCPFGAVQSWLWTLGRKLRLPMVKIPGRLEKFLRFSRYILLGLTFTGLALSLFITGAYGTFMGILSLNVARVTVASWVLFGVLMFAALFIERPFCRYLCTQGAQYGLLSLARLFTIKRNENKCINCRACDRACPTGVKIAAKKNVRNFQCINCFKCIEACPVKGALTYGPVLSRKGIKNEKKILR